MRIRISISPVQRSIIRKRLKIVGIISGVVAAAVALVLPLAIVQSQQNFVHGRGRLASERHLMKRMAYAAVGAERFVTHGLLSAAEMVVPGSEPALRSVSVAQSCLNSRLTSSGLNRMPSTAFASSVPSCQDSIISTMLLHQQEKPKFKKVTASANTHQSAKSSANKPATANGSLGVVSITQPSGTQANTKVTVVEPLQPLAGCSHGTTLNVVAHQDDDLLFMNPDTLQAIAGGRCMRTVYLTAGDSGQAAEYWQNREKGAEAAYAVMANAANNWTTSQQVINGKDITVATLNKMPNVSLVFVRLPDGNLHGEGFSSTASQSLQSLFGGVVASISSIDSVNSFNKDQLVAMLASIMQVDNPDQIHTLGLASTADGDHSDHLVTGNLTTLAAKSYNHAPVITQYGGYPDKLLQSNLSADDLATKQAVFLTYAQYDNAVCQSADACAHTDTYGNYLTRQYKTDVSLGTP